MRVHQEQIDQHQNAKTITASQYWEGETHARMSVVKLVIKAAHVFLK